MEFWNHLQMQLEHKGFCRVENKKNWYWQEENPVLYLICLLDGAEEGWREENMTFADFAGKMEGSCRGISLHKGGRAERPCG